MTNEEAIGVLQNEQECVRRQSGKGCDRNCAACDLVLPDKVIVAAYDMAIAALRGQGQAETNGLTPEGVARMGKALAFACRVLGGDNWEQARQAIFDTVDHEPVCRVCGCTQDNACAGGCYWVEADLCSSCAQKAEAAQNGGDE